MAEFSWENYGMNIQMSFTQNKLVQCILKIKLLSFYKRMVRNTHLMSNNAYHKCAGVDIDVKAVLLM